MAIYQDIQITVNQGLAQPDKSLYIFRGDSNIILNFKLVNPEYKLTKDSKDNLVTRFGVDNFELRLQLEKGYDRIIRGQMVENGVCSILLTQNIIQQLRVGSYTYQITLIDADDNAIMTFPACNSKLNILDRLSLNAEEFVNATEAYASFCNADTAILAIADEEPGDILDDNGEYNKKVWVNGDLIMASDLNRLEWISYLNRQLLNEHSNTLNTQNNQITNNASRLNELHQEIVDARQSESNSYSRLGDRLDAVDSQLEHNIKREIGIINNLKNSYNIKLVEHEFNVNRLDFKTLLTPTTNTNNWTVENGVLSSNLSTLNFAIFNNTMCDGTIEFTCLNPKNSSWFGALVGYDDVKNNALVVMIKNNYLEYWRIQGDEFQPLGLNTVYLGDDVRTSIIDDVPVNIRIERRGNLVATYINDKLISNEEESFFSNLRYKNGIVANNDNNFSFTNLLVNEYLFNNSFKINDGMCIGTSITHGINQDVKWVDLFNQKIKDNIMFSDDVILRNEGRSGFTSEEILGILPAVYTNYSDTLDYINIEVGMNDLKNTNKLTSDDTIDNIRKMIHFCKQRNLNCTVTTITPLLEGYGTVGGEPMWVGGYKQYFDTNTKIRKLCLLENIRCIDNAKSFNNLSIEELKNIIDDGVHPNEIGAEIMAETAIKTLIGCLY